MILLSSCSWIENKDVENILESTSSWNTLNDQSWSETEVEINTEEGSNEPIPYCKWNIVESCFEENGFTLNQLWDIKEYYKSEIIKGGADTGYHTVYFLDDKSLYFISRQAIYMFWEKVKLWTRVYIVQDQTQRVDVSYGSYIQPIFNVDDSDKLIVPSDLSYVATMDGEELIDSVWWKDILEELSYEGIKLLDGSEGPYVKYIQIWLLKRWYNLTIDWYFGPETKNAVIEFQEDTNLLQDGIVWPDTWGRLFSYSNAEYDETILKWDEYVKKWEYSNAIAEYKKAIEIYEFDAKPHNNVWWLLEQEWNTDVALEYYKTAYSLDENHENALTNLIGLYWSAWSINFNNADYSEAISYYEWAIPYLKGNDAELYNMYNNIGISYSASGNHDDGILYFNKAIIIDPMSSQWYTNKWRSLLYKWDTIQAKVNIDKALQLNQNDEGARELSGYFTETINTIQNNNTSAKYSWSSSRSSDYDDWYEWAEDNYIDDFDDCDDEFGSSYWGAEDGCNKYVQENNYSFDTTFWSYECTEDCSWHEAWYDWAEENWIDDEDDCDNWSNSFEEWCLEYVNE